MATSTDNGAARGRPTTSTIPETACVKRVIWMLWPSFLVAAVAEVVFFTVVDPQQLYLFGQPVDYPPLATYSIGFFLFWAACAASSFLTEYFQRGADEVNRR